MAAWSMDIEAFSIYDLRFTASKGNLKVELQPGSPVQRVGVHASACRGQGRPSPWTCSFFPTRFVHVHSGLIAAGGLPRGVVNGVKMRVAGDVNDSIGHHGSG